MEFVNAMPDMDIYDILNGVEEWLSQYIYYNRKEKELEASGYYEKIDEDDFNEVDYEIQTGKVEAINELKYIFENYGDVIEQEWYMLESSEKDLLERAKNLIKED